MPCSLSSSMHADDERSAVLLRQGNDLPKPLLALFEVDGVDDRLPLAVGERPLDHLRIGRVDHQRDLHLVDHVRRGSAPCRASSSRSGLARQMSITCAPPRTWRRAISPASSYFSATISSRNWRRADDVGPLADDHRPVFVGDLEVLDAETKRAPRAAAASGAACPSASRAKARDVRRRRAAATADQVHPSFVDEALEDAAIISGVSTYRPSSSGRPALGTQPTGTAPAPPGPGCGRS